MSAREVNGWWYYDFQRGGDRFIGCCADEATGVVATTLKEARTSEKEPSLSN
jgi:hypothetical protein